jgi:hypothetical protein
VDNDTVVWDLVQEQNHSSVSRTLTSAGTSAVQNKRKEDMVGPVLFRLVRYVKLEC